MFKTWQWWSSRSSRAAAMASSPAKIFGQSVTALLVVMSVEPR